MEWVEGTKVWSQCQGNKNIDIHSVVPSVFALNQSPYIGWGSTSELIPLGVWAMVSSQAMSMRINECLVSGPLSPIPHFFVLISTLHNFVRQS